MARKPRDTGCPAPCPRSLRWRDGADRPGRYPFTLPGLKGDFALALKEPVPIFLGANGAGTSARIERVAARLRAGWLAKVGRDGVPRAGRFEAVAAAALCRLTRRDVPRASPRNTGHFRLWLALAADPDGFAAVLAGDLGTLA